ncbi:MAG: LysR family transcriptional regulator [Myxococcota bacterium]
MRELRANLSRMMVFARVVEAGSFAGAARELGVARSVASEAVSTLEAELGCRLLHRSTRALRLTEAGEAFLERCQRMVDEARDAFAAVAATQERPTGVLRVTAPRMVADDLLVPVLADLIREHQLQVEIRTDDRRLNLVAEGFDASLRVGSTSTPGQIVRKLGKSEELLVAAPALAAEIRTPDELRAQSWICHDQIAGRVTLYSAQRKRVTVAMRALVRANDVVTMRKLVCAGVGVAMIPRLAVAELMRSGELVHLLPQYRIPPIEIFVLLPTRKHLPLRTRLLIQGLKERIREVSL